MRSEDAQSACQHLEAPWKPDAIKLARHADERSLSRLSGLLLGLYRFRRIRWLVRKFCNRLENGPMYSQTWRQILARYHQVEVGRYSYGDVLKPGLLPPGTRVGAYCSVGMELIVRRRNHPVHRPFLHPFFYESSFGFLLHETIEHTLDRPLDIGNDVWIGARVTVLRGCSKIGNGAILAAGAVVTSDVPPYTIVAGVPAKPIGTRFEADRIAELEASRWWERDIATLLGTLPVRDVFTP